MKHKQLNLLQISSRIKVDIDCLLYFFRKNFYNIEREDSVIPNEYYAKLQRCKGDKTISKFFIDEGYKVFIENGMLTTIPKPKGRRYKRIITTGM